MKKVFASILCCAMLLALLSGCVRIEIPGAAAPTVNSNAGNEESSPTAGLTDPTEPQNAPTEAIDTPVTGYITSKEDFVRIASQLLDLSLYDELEEDIDEDTAYYSYDISYEKEMSYPLDYRITIDNSTTFTMPYPLPELAKQGWSISDSSASNEIKAGFMSWAWCENTNDQVIYISAYNPTEETITFGDCSVCGVEIEFYDTFEHIEYKNAPDFTICGNITKSSKLEDILSTLKNPSRLSLWIYYDENGNYDYSEIDIEYEQPDNVQQSLEITLSGDGNYIISMEYENIPK